MLPDGVKIRKIFLPAPPSAAREPSKFRLIRPPLPPSRKWREPVSRRLRLACVAMPPRGPDLGRLLAAVNEQRAPIAAAPWNGLTTERAPRPPRPPAVAAP